MLLLKVVLVPEGVAVVLHGEGVVVHMVVIIVEEEGEGAMVVLGEFLMVEVEEGGLMVVEDHIVVPGEEADMEICLLSREVTDMVIRVIR